MKNIRFLVLVALLGIGGCMDRIKSVLEVPMAIQQKIKAESVHITESPENAQQNIHIGLNANNPINPKTDFFKVLTIAYQSADTANKINIKQKNTILHYFVDIASGDSVYRDYYFSKASLDKGKFYWLKVKTLLDNAAAHNKNQLLKLVKKGVDITTIINLFNRQPDNKNNIGSYHYLALQDVDYNNKTAVKVWVQTHSENNDLAISFFLDPEDGKLLDVVIKPLKAYQL